MPLSWRPFLVSTSDARIPPLLIAQSFTGREYEVYLTDLSHLWCEKLDRRAINRRSLIADTSIDPTEDDEQMKLLLTKLEFGLNCGKEVDVAMSIRQDGRGEPAVDGLDIKIKMELPQPFKPLEWTFEFISCPAGQLVSYFTLPLIQAQNERLKELESLIEILTEKDHVIQKLADKLEQSGTELGQVFPSAAGKGGRKLTRKTIEERVRGLAAFDKASWEKDVHDADLDGTAKDVKDVVEGACAPPPKLVLPGGGNDVPKAWGNWWQQLRDEAVQISTPVNDEGADAVIEDTPAPEDDEGQSAETVEEIEVPGTPPPVNQQSQKSPARPSRARHIVDDDETDDKDLDAASQSQLQKVQDSFISPQKQPTKAPAKKLGGIGGKKTAVEAKSPTPPSAHPARNSQSQTVREDDDTAAGEDGFEEAQPRHTSPEKSSSQKRAASPTPPPAEPSPKKTPRKGGLGKIGGKKKVSPPPDAEQSETHADWSQMTSRAKPKLGQVGGKKDDHEDDGRGRSDKKEEEKPRETSTEARQRRKREMQERLEKEAARPKKKKRVF